MTDPRSNQPGSALTRSALERVLARAAELQAASGDADEGGAMTEEQLVELGKEVGLSGELLRQALAEERSRTLVPAESGLMAALTGAAGVSASRTVPGAPAVVLGALDAWMQRAESLMVKRQFADQLVWEGRRDVFSIIRRTLFSGRGFELVGASDVSAIVASVGPNKTHTRIVADFSASRSERAATGAAVAVVALLAAIPLIVIGIAPALAAVPAVLGAALALFVTRRRYRSLVARAQVTLEQALDRLEFVDQKAPTTAQVLLDALLGPPRPQR